MGHYMKKKYKVVLLLSGLWMMLLIFTGCQREAEQKTMLFTTIIEEKEVSDIVFYKDSIYAGGMEGLYRINPQSYQYEEVEIGQVFLIKDLMIYEEKLYIGHDSGITVYDGKDYYSILDSSYEVPDFRVNALMANDKNQIWAGTFMGALKLENNQWDNISTEDGLAFHTVSLMMEDGYGGMIFGHYGSGKDGISYYKNGEWQYFNIAEGLPHSYITAGKKEGELIYIATGFYDVGGVAVFKVTNEGIKLEKSIVKEWGKFGSKARSINIEDSYIWIGTEYNGICLMKGDEFARFDEEDGLSNNEVKAILFDGERVWLATRKGVAMAEKKSLYDLFDLRK
jgi:ligand-binding sensor domain-containing protein